MAERGESPGVVDQDDRDAPSAWFASWEDEATAAMPRTDGAKPAKADPAADAAPETASPDPEPNGRPTADSPFEPPAATGRPGESGGDAPRPANAAQPHQPTRAAGHADAGEPVVGGSPSPASDLPAPDQPAGEPDPPARPPAPAAAAPATKASAPGFAAPPPAVPVAPAAAPHLPPSAPHLPPSAPHVPPAAHIAQPQARPEPQNRPEPPTPPRSPTRSEPQTPSDRPIATAASVASVASPVYSPAFPTPATNLLPVQAADPEAATVGLAQVAPVFLPEQPSDDGFDDEPPRSRVPVTNPKPRSRRKLGLIAAGVVGVLAALYAVDLLVGIGHIPRATTIAGVEVGGMTYQAAEEQLHTELDPRQVSPVQVQAAEVATTVDPTAAGLSLDWSATLERAKAQPLNPITRLATLFSAREVGIVTISDGEKLAGVLQALQPVVDRPVAEGNVRFEGLRPIPVDPVPGRALDIPAATGLLLRDWLYGATVELPMSTVAPATSPEAVRAAIAQVAVPAVSAPVTLVGERKQATVTPETIAAALTFVADGPNLRPQLQSKVVADAVRPALASTEQPGRDATIAIVGGRPVVTPSVDGRGIDFDKTLVDAPGVITRPDNRKLVAVYGDQPAKVTTEEINKLGITAVIGEFTTGGFAPDSGKNIRSAAAAINGSIVQPGQTFSLNGATGDRSAATGYIEAGIIEDGHPSRGIGGGVSQVATTLYNASYFAGMTNVEHREHSFYISRYPVAREATVVQGALDVKFRNDNPTGVYIQTVWTPSTITIRMFGTKRYEVTSATGPRSNPTTPNEVVIPPGQPCSPSGGSEGFTASDTRTLRDVNTGKTRSETRTVIYKPAPKVVCETPPS